VLIDVGDPSLLSQPAGKDDILLTTHEHSDHFDRDFVASFPGHRVAKGGSTSEGDIEVTGIEAAHGLTAGPDAGPDGSDYIYLVEMGGLRIAHFGDFGQFALTQAQLEALGTVDVAITQLDNPYSSVDSTNRLAYDMIGQVCPRILIPTHMIQASKDDMTLALTMWKGMYSPKNYVRLTPATLPQETTLLLLGARGASMGPAFDLPLSPW
jgi:L-ascorbate metabolism protein UlaG (beta-lactamase superfamily)